jgi:hypothetical protein
MTLGWRWFAAFSFLLLAVHEGHELVHAVAGRAICGEWPVRDFNAWRFTGPCASWWPTAAGPLFSYALMLVGALLRNRAAGVALVLAANPFARVFTVAMGGGDEMVVGQRIAGLADRPLALRIAVLLFVTLVCGAAIVAAWRMMRRPLWFAFALIWPMVLTGVALFVVGNRLLRAGVMAEPSITGAPLLVVLVSAAAVVMTVATLPWLTREAV